MTDATAVGVRFHSRARPVFLCLISDVTIRLDRMETAAFFRT